MNITNRAEFPSSFISRALPLLSGLAVAAPGGGTQFRIDYCDQLGGSASWQTMTNFTLTSGVRLMGVTPAQGTTDRALMTR
jgi:hypothetical protein